VIFDQNLLAKLPGDGDVPDRVAHIIDDSFHLGIRRWAIQPGVRGPQAPG
jgi:hypothetical protein